MSAGKGRRRRRASPGLLEGARPLGAFSEPGALHLSTVRRSVAFATTAAEAWGPTGARVLLGLVFAWFGYHELMAPGLWTGYVPAVSASSHSAEVLVLAHGWVLLVLAASLVMGIAPRLAAAVATVLLLEVVISLSVSGGLSDLVLRDVGVLGLAVSVVAARQQRLLFTR